MRPCRISLLASDGRTIELKHSDKITNMCFSPDGKSLATTCWDGKTRWWPLHDMAGPSPTVGSPATIPQLGVSDARCVFSHDGSCLAIVGGEQLVIWERSYSEGVVGETAWAEFAWKPRPSFDGQLVTPGVQHGTTHGRHGPRGRTLVVARVEDGQSAGAPIALNGLLVDSSVCAGSHSVAAATVEETAGVLTVYDIATGAPVFPSIALPDLPLNVAARPENSQVAVLCRNGKLVVIDTQQGEIVLDLSHDGLSLDQSPDDGLTFLSRVAYSCPFGRRA